MEYILILDAEGLYESLELLKILNVPVIKYRRNDITHKNMNLRRIRFQKVALDGLYAFQHLGGKGLSVDWTRLTYCGFCAICICLPFCLTER